MMVAALHKLERGLQLTTTAQPGDVDAAIRRYLPRSSDGVPVEAILT